MTEDQALACALREVMGRDEWFIEVEADALDHAERMRRRLRAKGFDVVNVDSIGPALAMWLVCGCPWPTLTHNEPG